MEKCPFCNSVRGGKTEEDYLEEIMKRVEANDAGAIWMMAFYYRLGRGGLQQDHARAMELQHQAAELGLCKAHYSLGFEYQNGGDMKKAKFHFEAAAMAGDEEARYGIGLTEFRLGKKDRAMKHWTIAASAGCFDAMHAMRKDFELGVVSRELIDSTLAAYNKSCAEMRSKARDAYIREYMVNLF
jgi:TPR repeat protein